MKNGIDVSFIARHKMLDCGLTKLIEIKLEVPKYYPTGKRLTKSDMERYIKDYYGFDVINWI